MAYGYFTGTLGDYLRTVSFTVTNGASNEKRRIPTLKFFERQVLKWLLPAYEPMATRRRFLI